MNISINWIKDYVALPEDITPRELGVKFTLATCEVEDVETTGAHLNEVKVVQVTSIEPHPDADKLRLVTFETGTGEKRVVCGAPNVEVGKKVPFAAVGVTLPGGFTLVPKKIRGVESEGMLCSEDELNLSGNHDGLMILADDAAVGISLAEHLAAESDIIFDIDNKSITHRPDLWGHYGMAREFAAIFDTPLKDVFSETWKENLRGQYTDEKPPVTIHVDPESCCLGFKGLSMDNVTVKPSPQWMQDRLNACGMRPINNIVDISNYVMLETGMPNHIYDRDTIKGGEIHVRRMGEDSVFVTLDEQDRKMIASDTMVYDAERVSGIGGIMGGLDSSISDTTTRIFLESANWKDSEVRKTSVRLGLRTDASQRYEKCLDTNQLEQTILRLVELMKESCPEAKVVGGMQEDGIQPTPELKIIVSVDKISRVLGTEVSEERVVAILESLDFMVEKNQDSLKVTVPSYRATKDIEFEDDIIEEIGRIIGYDNITPVSPVNLTETTRLSEAKLMQRRIQDFMVFNGRALEVMTYPMVGKKLLDQVSWPVKNEKLTLVNALSPELSRMRPSMVPSLLEKAAQNQKSFPSFRLFEVGRSYEELEGESYSRDRYQLGVVFFDKDRSPFMDLMNVMEPLMNYLNLNTRFEPINEKFPNPLVQPDWPGLHPNEYVDIKVMGKTCGFLNTLHPVISRQLKIKGNLSLAIFDITDFMDLLIKDKTKYQALPKFPGSDFDCTVVAGSQVPVSEILLVMKRLKVKQFENVTVVDVFKMNDEEKAVTLRTRFLDREKTLTPEVIKAAEEKVVATLAAGGFPLKV
ncbi:phenylalanine--tRNA ligase subunit beta [Desulfopila sp. IMCC35008]|uniref:phenylalanine--tRNA ligase subunit beta n=1 Tax=Desulfopila sp. IMCC35008 TaxID=2653858 RepID=UPI0013D1B990|nr:phenylalanine--tRNA ligase subunit beta [Desulfopila sp. IMCC35008]